MPLIHPMGFLASSGGSYQIARSLRFRSSASAYLSRTFGSPTNSLKWTYSTWVKRSSLGSSVGMCIFNCTTGWFAYGGSDLGGTADCLFGGADGGGVPTINTLNLQRDPSAFAHLVVKVDTTQATAADRVRMYINGVEVSYNGTPTYPTKDTAWRTFNTAVLHSIAKYSASPFYYYDGLLAETIFIDGQALDHTSFGQTDSSTGAWTPKAYTGTYGNNGFKLNFSDNSGVTPATLGKDTSGTNVLSTTGTTASSTALTAIAGTVSPQVNQVVTGSGIPANTYLTAVGGISGAWTATMSAAATTTVVGGALVFTGNNWTLNNISITAGVTNDSLTDTPTNYGTDTSLAGGVDRGNYAVLNPLDNGGGTLSNGNLKFTYASPAHRACRSAFALTTVDKFYWEELIGGSPASSSGMMLPSASLTSYIGDIGGYGYHGNGNRYYNGSSAALGATYTSGDIISYAWNGPTGTLTAYKNGTSQGDIITGLTGTYFPAVSSISNDSRELNFGQRPFDSSTSSIRSTLAASGFKALCTQNLPDPAILKPSSYFNAILLTGDNTNGRLITGVGHQPDFLWGKNRSSALDHFVNDSVRGAGLELRPDTTGVETSSGYVSAFGADGFTLNTGGSGISNSSGGLHVYWSWKKGVTPGFDIVSYTGNGTARTISHALGVAPKMMIVKGRNTTTPYGWFVYHSDLSGANYRLELQSTAGQANGGASSQWNSTAPTSSVFSVGGSSYPEVNENAKNYIAYLFAEVAGFSKFGSYTGNGSADGPFVWCGFKPRWIMTKRIDTAGNSWRITDTARTPYNAAINFLAAEIPDVENGGGVLDILSNGFKQRETGAGVNASGSTYIFMAFAEAPFKTARAR